MRVSYQMRVGILSALVIISSACSSITGGCAKPQTEEITYNDPFYSVKIGFIDAWRKQGYTCTSVAIRDAFGNQIGDTYTCTRC